MIRCDVLVVGAGFAGLVMAERLASRLGLHCLVIDKRSHIGGNAYDEHDRAGVLIHRYGPHYFRATAPHVIEYLSRFTDWHPVSYRIKSYVDGRYWSFPINLETYEQLIGRPSTSEEFAAYLAAQRLDIPQPANSEEVITSQVGWRFYEMFFRGYTRKQWKRDPRELDASVCGRIPIRSERDDRYLREPFQALPRDGYTRLFERLIASIPRLELRTGVDYREVRAAVQCRHTIYTGAIDEYFDCCDGPLPYRSLRFEPESFGPDALASRLAISGKPGFWQPAMQVNYPGDEPFTRIVEIKHATGQQCEATTIVREYPEDYVPGGEAYYPIPAPDAAARYERYRARAAAERDVSFVGRLATYRYYNMDQVVALALKEGEALADRLGAAR